MTASIKEREDKLCDRELHVEDQEIKLKTRTIGNRGALGLKETGIEPERQVERTEDGIVLFDRDTDGQEQRLARRAQRLQEQEEAIAGRLLS